MKRPRVRGLPLGTVTRLTGLSALCTALVSTAAAADPLAELLRCRQIAAVPARVACYDAITVPLAAAPAAAPPPRVAVPAPALGPTPAAPVATFGLPVTVQPVAENLETRIVGAFDGWTPQSKIRLANGQLWQIADGSEGAYQLRDPKVNIRRSGFGGYFMQIEGISQTPKVRRIE